MKKQKVNWIYVALILVVIFVVMSNQKPKEIKKMAGPDGATITRSITPASVAPNGVFTVTVTVTKGTSDLSGVIYETIPSGFTLESSPPPYSIGLQGVIDKNTNPIQAPFLLLDSSGTFNYKVKAGSSSQNAAGNIDWALPSGKQNEVIGGDTQFIIDGSEPPDDGITTPTEPNYLLYGGIAAGVLLLVALMKKK